jgi:Glyoxalase-like domain
MNIMEEVRPRIWRWASGYPASDVSARARGKPIASLVVDAADAELLAQFWARALGWQVVNRDSSGVSIGVEGSPFEIGFLRSYRTDRRPANNRLHLDVKPLNRD